MSFKRYLNEFYKINNINSVRNICNCLKKFPNNTVSVSTYEHILKMNSLQYKKENIKNVDSELLNRYISNMDYHTLMALKHASCGMIDTSFLHRNRCETDENED